MFLRGQRADVERLRSAEAKAPPAVNVTITDDEEVCIEWWRGDEKFTFYGNAVDVIHVTKDGKVEDGTVEDLADWLRGSPSSCPGPADEAKEKP